MNLHVIGIDLGKATFHLVGLNQAGEVQVRKKFSRTQLLRGHSRSQCGATLNTQLVCESCGTKRVWQGKLGAACVGCGAKIRQREE
jgi:hypothetical protein